MCANVPRQHRPDHTPRASRHAPEEERRPAHRPGFSWAALSGTCQSQKKTQTVPPKRVVNQRQARTNRMSSRVIGVVKRSGNGADCHGWTYGPVSRCACTLDISAIANRSAFRLGRRQWKSARRDMRSSAASKLSFGDSLPCRTFEHDRGIATCLYVTISCSFAPNARGAAEFPAREMAA
jgi:hypothetical protein